jgi:group I intron endonuclease
MYTYYSLRSLAKSNRPIDRALLKYGFSNFILEILEYCDKNNVIEREQYYMDLIKPQYNIVEIAGSTLGYKHTPKSLSKMRDFVLSDEVRNRKALSTVNATAARII